MYAFGRDFRRTITQGPLRYICVHYEKKKEREMRKHYAFTLAQAERKRIPAEGLLIARISSNSGCLCCCQLHGLLFEAQKPETRTPHTTDDEFLYFSVVVVAVVARVSRVPIFFEDSHIRRNSVFDEEADGADDHHEERGHFSLMNCSLTVH